MKATSTLPTQPGLYLFVGTRRTPRPDDLHHLGVELVRVGPLSDGKLAYIGTDFFHCPQEAVGMWLPINDLTRELNEAGRHLVTHALLQRLHQEFLEETGWKPDSFQEWLPRKLFSAWNTSSLSKRNAALLKELIAAWGDR